MSHPWPQSRGLYHSQEQHRYVTHYRWPTSDTNWCIPAVLTYKGLFYTDNWGSLLITSMQTWPTRTLSVLSVDYNSLPLSSSTTVWCLTCWFSAYSVQVRWQDLRRCWTTSCSIMTLQWRPSILFDYTLATLTDFTFFSDSQRVNLETLFSATSVPTLIPQTTMWSATITSIAGLKIAIWGWSNMMLI